MSFLVLVVDDESDVEDLFRQQFRRDLRAGRFTMDFAQSGDGALQRIRDAAGASLILILSDINMPGMTGLELLPKAKALRPDVPVIMITAYADNQTQRKALEGGAEALLTKPIDFGALRSEIDSQHDGVNRKDTEAGKSRFSAFCDIKGTSRAAGTSRQPAVQRPFPLACLRRPRRGRLCVGCRPQRTGGPY